MTSVVDRRAFTMAALALLAAPLAAEAQQAGKVLRIGWLLVRQAPDRASSSRRSVRGCAATTMRRGRTSSSSPGLRRARIDRLA